MPFLSFFGLLFSTLWWLLFYLVLVMHHIKDNLLPSELFLPDKISYSLCQLAFLYFPLVKTYLERCLEIFSEGYKVIIFHVFFFFFKFWTWTHLALYHYFRKCTGQKKQDHDKKTLVPTKTLPIPTSEPFCAGNTLVRPRRVHTLLIWTSACGQAFVNIWKTEKPGHKHFIRLLKQKHTLLMKWRVGWGRCVLSTFWWRKC